MKPMLIAGLCCLLSGALLWGVALPKEKDPMTYLDLQPKANHKLKDPFHGSGAGNDLAELPQGEQKLAGVRFKIGPGLIQLGGRNFQIKPEKVEGIKVGLSCAKLHILHATAWGFSAADNTVIGKYVVHYKDKTKETIEIVQGKDVRDWWLFADTPGVTRGKVAWVGLNAHARNSNAKIRLYLTTWQNPHPKKEVAAIDYLSTKTTPAAPFCVAITVQGK
jgi:hypothetical protein